MLCSLEFTSELNHMMEAQDRRKTAKMPPDRIQRKNRLNVLKKTIQDHFATKSNDASDMKPLSDYGEEAEDSGIDLMAQVNLSEDIDCRGGQSVGRNRNNSRRYKKRGTKPDVPMQSQTTMMQSPLLQVQEMIKKVGKNQERGIQFLSKNGPLPTGPDNSRKQELDSVKYVEYNIKKNPQLFESQFLNIQAYIDKKRVEN